MLLRVPGRTSLGAQVHTRAPLPRHTVCLSAGTDSVRFGLAVRSATSSSCRCLRSGRRLPPPSASPLNSRTNTRVLQIAGCGVSSRVCLFALVSPRACVSSRSCLLALVSLRA
eukprot:3940829-Rhodomonas_salina.1